MVFPAEGLALMLSFFWVALGGAVGSALRFGVNLAAPQVLGTGFPWATFIVNILGSFVMGLLSAALVEKFSDQPDLRLFVTTGVLGGFTTFSAFSLDVFGLMQRGENSVAIVYVLASVSLSILAVFAGFMVARALHA
jgi:fluoride exporter